MLSIHGRLSAAEAAIQGQHPSRGDRAFRGPGHPPGERRRGGEEGRRQPVTIYNHFHDKDGLVREAVTRLAMDHWSRFRAILEGDSPFVEKLERVVALKREMADWYSSELVRSAISADPQIRRAVGSLFENQVNPLLLKFLKSGQREGAVRRDLSINALRIYLDMFTDVARTHPELFEGAKRPSKITREVWSLFLHGIGGGGGTGSR
jgi:AcrR family transcriptional regulator